jgi:hypothetical protein
LDHNHLWLGHLDSFHHFASMGYYLPGLAKQRLIQEDMSLIDYTTAWRAGRAADWIKVFGSRWSDALSGSSQDCIAKLRNVGKSLTARRTR